jgi:hypothetical protein
MCLSVFLSVYVDIYLSCFGPRLALILLGAGITGMYYPTQPYILSFKGDT